MSRILRLALLAPDTMEMILEGRSDQALMLEQLERPLPASWKEQRRLLGWSKRSPNDRASRRRPGRDRRHDRCRASLR
jgi:hypothetical protein